MNCKSWRAGTDPPGASVARHGRASTRDATRPRSSHSRWGRRPDRLGLPRRWRLGHGRHDRARERRDRARDARARRLVSRLGRLAEPRPLRRHGGCGGDRAGRLDRPERVVVDRRRSVVGRARQGDRPARLRCRRARGRRASRQPAAFAGPAAGRRARGRPRLGSRWARRFQPSGRTTPGGSPG